MTRWFYVAVMLTVGAFASSYYVHEFRYDELPAQVPIHWNLEGQPDGFVPKSNVFMAFLLLPTVMAGMLGLTLALPWLSPKKFEVGPRGLYHFVMLLVIGLLGFIHVLALGTALHPAWPMDRLLVGGLCFFFAAIGAVLGQVPRNFYIGVRTPWTLASDEVWQRTHQLAARLFVAAGLAGMLIALVQLPVWLAFVAIMAAAFVPVIYSLAFYKSLERQGRI